MKKLDVGSTYPTVLFRNRCAIGSLKNIDPSATSYYACDFPIPRKTNLWNAFPEKFHLQPEHEYILDIPHVSPAMPSPVYREDSPNFEEWREMIAKFKKRDIPKVVLARKTTFVFDHPLDPLEMFTMIYNKCGTSTPFAFLMGPHTAFLGATPELLFHRDGALLKSEALAGTRPIAQAAELLTSSKDLLEFEFVKKDIAAKLYTIAKPFSVEEEVYLKNTPNLCHLSYPFSVELKERYSDQFLIDHIHPTPAVSGYPKAEALKIIEEFEPFDRGWYASALGEISSDESSLFVGIRSALIVENKLHLFSGAGIVHSSIAENEWDELDHKIDLWRVGRCLDQV